MILHSDTETFFKELKEAAPKLPVVERSLNPVAEGCYTSQIRIKQKHRLLENELYSSEKMASAAALLQGKNYPKQALRKRKKPCSLQSFTMRFRVQAPSW